MTVSATDREKLVMLMEVFLNPRSRENKHFAAKCFVRRWAIAHGAKEFHPNVDTVLWRRYK